MNVVQRWWKNIAGSQEPVKKQALPKRTVVGNVSKDTRDFRDKFFSLPDDPKEPLTSLQDRMQSGGR